MTKAMTSVPSRRAAERADGRRRGARAARAALVEIDLDVPAGTTVALVGATGSGKTSLVSLIPRLYDTSEGRVLLDGSDVRGLELRELRESVAIVSDDPFLFSATVAENIAYGRPDAGEAEIEAAARRAQAYDFISALPRASRPASASVASRSPAAAPAPGRSPCAGRATRGC